jgi:hypothetical protein
MKPREEDVWSRSNSFSITVPPSTPPSPSRLICLGADPNARTVNGGTPLWWAEEYHPSAHPSCALLQQHTQDPSAQIIPLPQHTPRRLLPHKYCQVASSPSCTLSPSPLPPPLELWEGGLCVLNVTFSSRQISRSLPHSLSSSQGSDSVQDLSVTRRGAKPATATAAAAVHHLW